jgi:hypothetical protein
MPSQSAPLQAQPLAQRNRSLSQAFRRISLLSLLTTRMLLWRWAAPEQQLFHFTAANADPLPASVNAPIAVKTAGTSAISVALDPINRLLYIGEASGTSGSNNGVLRAVSYGSISGNPTEVAGSPFTTGGLSPASILPVASGAYVYVANATVANSSTGNVSGFSLTASGTTYTLTPLGSTASAGVTPASLAEDSTGTVVLLVNSGGSPDLNVYTFDSAVSGKLDSALTSSTGNDPVGALAIAAAP